MGNLASVAKALARSGADVRVTQSVAEVRGAGAVVLPGVGAFRDAAARLEQSGLGAAVLERIAAGAPFLGVCLGLQLLFESSGEGGRWPGLGVLAGTRRAAGDRPQGAAHRLERAGVGAGRRGHGPRAAGPGHRLLRPLLRRTCRRTRRSSPPTTDYGGPVVAAVARDNVWAVQFHPEKSSRVGLALLAGFVATIHREAGTS